MVLCVAVYLPLKRHGEGETLVLFISYSYFQDGRTFLYSLDDEVKCERMSRCKSMGLKCQHNCLL